MWLLIVPVCLILPFFILTRVTARRFRRRDVGMVRSEVEDFARIALDPLRAAELSFTGPHRDDADRAHDTMFTARHGHRLLSFILDTSRMRIRWWVLYELYAPENAGAARTLRKEATFIESAIPSDAIRELLKAARGERPAPPSPPPAEPEKRVDPFEPPESSPTEPAVQA